VFADANKQTGPQTREKNKTNKRAVTSSDHNDTM